MASDMQVDPPADVALTDMDAAVRAIEGWVDEVIAAGQREYQDADARERWILKRIAGAYSRALEASREDVDVIASYAVTLLRLGRFEDAWAQFLKVLMRDPDHKRALVGWGSACCRVIPRWHFFMVNDAVRNFAYETALRKTIGSYGNARVHVLDIGAGSGILSFMALKAGAHRVYACEMSPVIATLAECAMDSFEEKNPEIFVEQGIKLLRKHSSKITIPGDMLATAQVCVTETFDSGLFCESAVDSIVKAWNYLLKSPDPRLCGKDERETNNILFGSCFCEATVKQTRCWPEVTELDPRRSVVVPFRACLWAVLVESDDIALRIKPKQELVDKQPEGSKIEWNDDDGNYDCERLPWLPKGYKFLCDPVRITTLDFMDKGALITWNIDQMGVDFSLRTTTPGRPDCIATWFNLHLSPTVTITSHPAANSCWEQAIYPIDGRRFDEVVPAGTEIQLFVEKDITIEKRGLRFCGYVDAENSSDESDSDEDSDNVGQNGSGERSGTENVPKDEKTVEDVEVAGGTTKHFNFDQMRFLNTDAFYPNSVGDTVVQLGGHRPLVKARFPESKVYAFAPEDFERAKDWIGANKITPTDVFLFPIDRAGLLEPEVVSAWAEIREICAKRIPVFPKAVELKVQLIRSTTLAKMWSVQRNSPEVRRVDKAVMECVSESMGRVSVPYHWAISPGSIKDAVPCSEELSVVTMDFVDGANLSVPMTVNHMIRVFGGEWPNAALAKFCLGDSGDCWNEVAVKFDPRFIDGARKPVIEMQCKILSNGMVSFKRVMNADDFKKWKPKHKGRR